MSTATASSRQRPPLRPADVAGAFLPGADADGFLHGTAVLCLTDNRTGAEAFYWCQANCDAGRLVGVRLDRFGDGIPAREKYDVYLAGPASCDCPDANFRPDRPGGCKHVVALRQALGLLAAAPTPPPPTVPKPAAYVACCDAEPVAEGDDLAAVLRDLEAIQEETDDVVVWRLGRVAAIRWRDGRVTYPTLRVVG